MVLLAVGFFRLSLTVRKLIFFFDLHAKWPLNFFFGRTVRLGIFLPANTPKITSLGKFVLNDA
jgi:hypothetical protein